MTLKQLMYFHRMSKALNYTKVAKELYISQPSLSYTIKELEKELGVELFEKDPSTKRVRLTKDGVIFAKYVSASLASLEEGVGAIKKSIDLDKTTLKIGYIHTFPLHYINKLFHDYLAIGTNSNIVFDKEISTSNTQLLQHLSSRKLNFAFCLSLDDSVIGIPFFKQELWVMVSKSNPLANKEEILFEELSQMSCVRVPHAAEVNAVVDSLYQQYNMVPNIAFEAGNISASLVYIMESNCFTVAPILAGVDFSQISILKVKGGTFIESPNIFCVE